MVLASPPSFGLALVGWGGGAGLAFKYPFWFDVTCIATPLAQALVDVH